MLFAFAPQVIGGPMLGFIPDAGGKAIRPVIGIPGASMLGQRLELDDEIRGATISPKQDYAIGLSMADAQTVVIDVAAQPPVETPVTGAHPGAELIAISPTGSVAALYDAVSRAIQVIGGLPRNPAVVAEFDASAVPGRLADLAISDDGTVAIVKAVDSDDAGLWVVASSNGPWRVPLDRAAAAAFFPKRRDAVVTDDATRSAFLMLNIDQAGTLVHFFSAPDGIEVFSSVSVAEDSGRLFLADAHSGVIATVNTETRMAVMTSCGCQPTGLHRLSGNSIFRLTESSSEPLVILDASSDEPLIGIIPPSTPAMAQPE